MASISKDPKGNVNLQFIAGDKKRRTIRLGKVNQTTAESVKLKVEHLHNATVTKSPLDAHTARWVAGIGDDLAAKLAAVGLIPPRAKGVTGGVFLTEWLAAKEAAGFQPASLVAWGQTVAELTTLLDARSSPSLTPMESGSGTP